MNRSLKWVAIFIMFKLQFIFLGAGGFILITHFNLHHLLPVLYYPIGYLCLGAFLYGIFPVPELEIKFINRIVDEEN